MLIETDTGGEREIGANPYEHSSPMGVLDIEVIWIDPTPLHLEMPTDGIDLAIEVEKADGTLWLLKGLNRGMKQDAIEATVGETDVILMVFVKGVHGVLQA